MSTSDDPMEVIDIMYDGIFGMFMGIKPRKRKRK